MFLEVFFKIVRILLETPNVPKLEWPSFGGSQFESKSRILTEIQIIKTIYPIEEPDITIEGADVQKADVPVPDASDYNKYEKILIVMKLLNQVKMKQLKAQISKKKK